MEFDLLLPRERNGHPMPNPFEMFIPSDEMAESDPQYFGFQSLDGGGYIFKYNRVAGTMRYFLSKPGHYQNDWMNAASQVYDLFATVFQRP